MNYCDTCTWFNDETHRCVYSDFIVEDSVDACMHYESE